MEWRLYWYLDRVEGCTKRAALSAIYRVLRHPSSWERTGVAFTRTMQRERADIELSVISSASTLCGPGAAGCFCDGCRVKADGTPLATAECGVEYIDDAVGWAGIVGMELCGHGAFAALDMYTSAHQPYQHGAMGNWDDAGATGGMPSDDEVRWCREWLAGATPTEFIHND